MKETKEYRAEAHDASGSAWFRSNIDAEQPESRSDESLIRTFDSPEPGC